MNLQCFSDLQTFSEMGNNQSALEERGYTLVKEQDKMKLVKNESGDQLVIKTFRDAQVSILSIMIFKLKDRIIKD